MANIHRLCFFFSSRRRHTRSLRDWSSDVCSSDLVERVELLTEAGGELAGAGELGEAGLLWQGDELRQVRMRRPLVPDDGAHERPVREIGRASCRERG